MKNRTTDDGRKKNMNTEKQPMTETGRIKRTDEIVNAIKESIMADNLMPGD